LYRRSLYTFWKRQAPPPAFLIFDAPTRETCTVRRARTNTPAQALVLLNDETYVAAARGLAAIALEVKVDGSDAERADIERLDLIFDRVLSRAPDATERDVLLKLLNRQRTRFAADRAAAQRLAGSRTATGTAPSPEHVAAARAQHAAWTAVAQVILNLDEALTSR
jgi:hypothetical protein